MSGSYGSKQLGEGFQEALNTCAKWLFWLGLLSVLVSTGLLIFTCYLVAGNSSLAHQATQNIEIFNRVEILGAVGLGIGGGYLFWGESGLTGLLVLGSAILYFGSGFLPTLIGSNATGPAIDSALSAIQVGGIVLGIISVVTLVAEVYVEVRDRAKVGVKADQLKYGKGIKEEADRQNVFMGNCWQLPYCRKFVRERCPIFHSKRTCWRERVGCMCEEEVIRNAMANKPVPKDALLAAKMIPKNFRLNEQQKIERCRNCVIYNEHQRHKYKAGLWVVLGSFILVYGLLHGPLIDLAHLAITRAEDVVNSVTIRSGKPVEIPEFFIEGLLFVSVLVAFTYSLKLLEFCVFKLKI